MEKVTINEKSFKKGNVRSLAMSLVKAIGKEKAWDIAKRAKDKFGEFDYNQAMSLISKNVGTKQPTAKKEYKKYTLKAGETKNAKIRELYGKGIGKTEIAHGLGLSFQRVTNIVKLMNGKKKSTSKAKK